jgi:hypothetical protein
MRRAVRQWGLRGRRLSKLAAGCLALLVTAQSPVLLADDVTPSVRDLVRSVERNYHLSTVDIAKYLTLWGTNVYTHEEQLVRWRDGNLAIAILIKDVSPQWVEIFKHNMDQVATWARHGASYCVDQVSPSGFDSSEVPDCLKGKVDVVVFIDGTPESSSRVFQGLQSWSTDQLTKDFWGKYAEQPSQPTTFCEAHNSFDAPQITGGLAYYRLIEGGAENLKWVKACNQALPFLIFGQRPIRTSATSQAFVVELLQLTYSSALRPGMQLDEVQKQLDEDPL